VKKQFLLGGSLLALAGIGPAHAAPPAPPAIAIYNWTGWYVGGNVGYSWGKANSTYSDPGFNAPNSFSGTEHLNGAIAGGQVGYNWQVGTSWVWGIEADLQVSGERGSRSYASDCEGSGVTCLQSQSAKIPWFGTVRGRFGTLINPSLLVYATGGLAFGEVSASGTVNITSVPISWGYSNSTTNTGWTLGAGIEGALPGSRAWTWKVEYLYLDLGSVSGTGRDPFFGTTYAWTAKFTDNILRVGFNYGFH
jgi:outer membrane immunogenic protein